MKKEIFCHKDGFICHPKNNKYCHGCKVLRKRQLLTMVSIVFLCAVAIFISMILSGCENTLAMQKQIANKKTNLDKAVDSCIAAGGVPLFYNVGGGLKECQFKPGVKS